jgi:membrane-associated protein
VNAVLTPLLLGMSWMEPQWWLDHFGTQMVWFSLVVLVIECGLFFPFLPGDTLLFAIGLFVATGAKVDAAGNPKGIDFVPGPHAVDLLVIIVLFIAAAFAGNVIGYEIGRAAGTPLYERNGRFLKKKYFEQAHAFFEKHGNKALVIGRFVPVVRTFVTVVAGVSQMERRRFFTWSLVGAIGWVTSVTLLGYLLGQAYPGLGDNLDKAIILVVAVSLVPVAFEWWRHRRNRVRH